LALTISFGFTGCVASETAGLKLINDTNQTQYIVVAIDGEWETNNSDELVERTIMPSATLTIRKFDEFTYGIHYTYFDEYPFWHGFVLLGDTMELRFSALHID
jgi:hypothetical protein